LEKIHFFGKWLNKKLKRRKIKKIEFHAGSLPSLKNKLKSPTHNSANHAYFWEITN